MEDEKLKQEPAFPTIWIDDDNKVYKGINKRFYTACVAMQGLLANPSINIPDYNQFAEFAKVCFRYADELLKEENNNNK